jgi:transcriptional regulator with XRE-family HTH domain
MASIIVTYLRRERRKWGLTQSELALLVGIKSRAQISSLEHGIATPTAEQLLAFQFLFGLTTAQLFPQLAVRAQESILRTAKATIKATDTDSTLRAQRKNTLLRQTLSRAVMS